VGEISASDYRRNLTKLKLLLSGKKKTLIKKLKKEIKTFSKEQKYEQAATVRDQLEILTQTTPETAGPDLNLPILDQDLALAQTKHLRRLLKPLTAIPATYPLNRIEAYDISNLMGEQATGSMVVFLSGRPAKEEYRLFKIKTVEGANDPAMIKEIIGRRVRNDWPTPDLIVIDGGRTQLKAALTALSWQIPVVGIAKHPDKLVVYNRNLNQFRKLTLPPNNPATKLIQALRDESHRFAKKYHTKLRLNYLRGRIP
jgi:excinuclease ABC subunit C